MVKHVPENVPTHGKATDSSTLAALPTSSMPLKTHPNQSNNPPSPPMPHHSTGAKPSMPSQIKTDFSKSAASSHPSPKSPVRTSSLHTSMPTASVSGSGPPGGFRTANRSPTHSTFGPSSPTASPHSEHSTKPMSMPAAMPTGTASAPGGFRSAHGTIHSTYEAFASSPSMPVPPVLSTSHGTGKTKTPTSPHPQNFIGGFRVQASSSNPSANANGPHYGTVNEKST